MKYLASVALLAFLSLGVVTENNDPRKVTITLIDGTSFTGEVLAVRESTVVLGKRFRMNTAEIATKRENVLVLPFREVHTIVTEGSSYAVVGFFSGMAVGCLGGYAIGSSVPVERRPDDTFGCNERSQRFDNEMTGAGLGALGGGIAGCAIGQASGSKGETIVSPLQRDFTFVRAVARFRQGEPAFLQEYGR